MRTIAINNIEYKVNCNALTYLYYSQIFKENIFDDINIVREFLLFQFKSDVLNIEENSKEILLKLNSFINAINRLTYVAIYTNNKNIADYAKWIEKSKLLEQDNDCIAIIIEDVVDCFIDEKVSEELERINKNSGDDTEVLFPEHFFISACLKMGLTIKDLELLTYVDVMKIFLSSTRREKKTRRATQADWDRLASRK